MTKLSMTDVLPTITTGDLVAVAGGVRASANEPSSSYLASLADQERADQEEEASRPRTLCVGNIDDCRADFPDDRFY